METIKSLLRFMLVVVIAFAISFSVGLAVLYISGSYDAVWSTNLFGGLGLLLCLGAFD